MLLRLGLHSDLLKYVFVLKSNSFVDFSSLKRNTVYMW